MSEELTISEFCDLHNAWDEDREWALENCQTMQEAWDTAKPEWLLWIATQPGVLTDRELRKLAVKFARSAQHLMLDKRSIDALDVADRHADGNATDEELSAARAAAVAAAADAAADAARSAAWAAAVAARAAAVEAVAAAVDAARSAAWADAWADAWNSFAVMIREYTPKFSRKVSHERRSEATERVGCTAWFGDY